MTKAEKLQQRIAAAQCPKGGVHEWECTWPSLERYIETCKKCGLERRLDASLGLGGRQEYARSRNAGKFVAED